MPSAPPKMQTRELTCRSVAIRANSVDEENRSVESVLATENPVTVFDMLSWRAIDEVLLMTGVESPPDYLPLLNNHFRFDVGDVLGSSREIRVEGGNMLGRLFFAEGSTESVEEKSWQKVKGGHVRDVSVGYHAIEFTDIPPGKTQKVAGKEWTAGDRTLRVTTKWKPFEVSLTPVGADEAAKIRAAGSGAKRTKPKPKPKRPQKRGKARMAKRSINYRKAVKRAIARQSDEELTRSQIVREMASAAGISTTTVRGILAGKKRATAADWDAFSDVLGIRFSRSDDEEREEMDDEEREDMEDDEREFDDEEREDTEEEV